MRNETTRRCLLFQRPRWGVSMIVVAAVAVVGSVLPFCSVVPNQAAGAPRLGKPRVVTEPEEDAANVVQLSAELDGGQVVPPTPSQAAGEATLKLNKDDNTYSFRLQLEGIQLLDVLAIHLHLGAAKKNGPLIYAFDVATLKESELPEVNLQIDDRRLGDPRAITKTIGTPRRLIVNRDGTTSRRGGVAPPDAASGGRLGNPRDGKLGGNPRGQDDPDANPVEAPAIISLMVDGLAFPPDKIADLLAGGFYVDVHTRAFDGGEVRGQLENLVPESLDTVPVPIPPNLGDFVKDLKKAEILGKALFWDMQVGSDGKQACASCHFHAGVDVRTKNAVGIPPNPERVAFRGANQELTPRDFPFHRFQDPTDRDSDVVFDTGEITGSQGVVFTEFLGINGLVDLGKSLADPVFHVRKTLLLPENIPVIGTPRPGEEAKAVNNGRGFLGTPRRGKLSGRTRGSVNVRRIEPRNTPTMINAVFNERNFWDGRANRFFNGVNPFGDTDPSAMVWSFEGGSAQQVRILLDNASLASQAVGPPLSDFEMSWLGRTFPDLGMKMVPRNPLALQKVHPADSVLGLLANKNGKGLKSGITYAALIREAFHEKWWGAPGTVDGKFTQMEANFSLFWGLAILVYERTLVSDDSPFDRFARGDAKALTIQQKAGMELFMKQGRCVNCHSGPEFTSAAISQLRNPDESQIEFMDMEIGPEAFYDSAFYNIGVRPTDEDLGVGGSGPFGPFSLTRRRQLGQDVGENVDVPRGHRVAVDGAFKTPSLRNVELTGPFMHNGGMKNLTEVVQFYARGADFFELNIDNLDPDVGGIGKIRGNAARVAALVAFLKSLTDDRVRFQKAPFDHPELTIANGHKGFDKGMALDNNVVIPAVGANGGPPLPTFEKILQGGGLK